MNQILKVLRVFKLTEGSTLNQAVTASSPVDGARWKIEAATDFEPETGGTGRVYNPATYDPEDSATYEDIEYAGVDEDTDELLGVIRTNPKAWTAGMAFVQEGIEPTIEKWAEGKLDDEEEIVSIPVPAALYPLLHLGVYDEETAPAVPIVYEEEDDQLFVSDAPVGAIPRFDEDLEVLPPVGGGDTSGATTDPDTGKVLPPKGMGFEDGVAPSSSPTPEVFGGIGNTMFVRWVTIANSSIVTYEVHCHTTASFTPAADTLVHSAPYAGTAGFKAMYALKDFPVGHVLDGGASDPPKPGTTYRFQMIAKDGSGAATASAEVTGTPTKIDGSVHITANSITATEIAADAITTSELAADSVTATEINVSSLSAITANLGTVTVGSITGLTITGGTIRTASSGNRVEMNDSLNDRIQFFNNSNQSIGYLSGAASGSSFSVIATLGSLTLDASTDLVLTGTKVHTEVGTPLGIGTFNAATSTGNHIEFHSTGGNPATPPTGRVRLYYNAASGTNGKLLAINASGAIRDVADFA